MKIDETSGIVKSIFGSQARFCDEECAESFKEDRKNGLIYGPYKFVGGGLAKNWEEASYKDEFCAYCNSDLAGNVNENENDTDMVFECPQCPKCQSMLFDNGKCNECGYMEVKESKLNEAGEQNLEAAAHNFGYKIGYRGQELDGYVAGFVSGYLDVSYFRRRSNIAMTSGVPGYSSGYSDGQMDAKFGNTAGYGPFMESKLNEENMVAVVDVEGDSGEDELGLSTSGYYVATVQKDQRGTYSIINKMKNKIQSWKDADAAGKSQAADTNLKYLGYLTYLGNKKFAMESKLNKSYSLNEAAAPGVQCPSCKQTGSVTQGSKLPGHFCWNCGAEFKHPQPKKEDVSTSDVANPGTFTGFGGPGVEAKLKDNGDGTFSIIVTDNGEEIPVETGLNGEDAQDVLASYQQMFTSGEYHEAKGRKMNPRTQRVIESVARGRSVKGMVASLLKSYGLYEDDDVGVVLPAADTKPGDVLPVDLEDPKKDAATDTAGTPGPSTPITPDAGSVAASAPADPADLASKKDGDVDAAVAAASGPDADPAGEFMQEKIERRVSAQMARILGKDASILSEETEDGISDRAARRRRLIEKIRRRRLAERTRSRRLVEEGEGGPPPEVQAKIDAKKADAEPEKKYGEEDGEKKEAVRFRKHEEREIQLMGGRVENKGTAKYESISESFRTAFRDLNEEDNVGDAVEAPAEKTADEPENTPAEVTVAPTESIRARLRRRRLEARRRFEADSDDVVFPPADVEEPSGKDYTDEEPGEKGGEEFTDDDEKKENFLDDFANMSDDQTLSKPESHRRRFRRARIEGRRSFNRRRVNEAIFSSMFQLGEKVKYSGGSNPAIPVGTIGEVLDQVPSAVGATYLIQFENHPRATKVSHNEIEKVTPNKMY